MGRICYGPRCPGTLTKLFSSLKNFREAGGLVCLFFLLLFFFFFFFLLFFFFLFVCFFVEDCGET